ncbi:MAG: succinate dehydrogenase, hydrophobic membrane anchor protein [Gammaproteobacteria bacterium]|nr:succinate dehydrogenase, hydrophobic membrane anchor protein [Gammaproteobacteria bacterium]
MSWRAGGVRPFVLQRVSAVYLAFFIVAFAVCMLVVRPTDYIAWMAFLQQPVIVVGVALFWLAAISHAWVGGRDVIMDYVHPDGLRVALLSLLGMFLLAMLIWVLRILLVI